MQSKIVLTRNFQALKDELLAKFDPNSLKFFENAKEVITQAYVAESSPKMLVLMAKNFRHEAQNSLLKIIEEPPRNIYFLIATMSKNTLLQTIRSRLVLDNRLEKIARVSSGLNLKRLELKEIYDFIDEKVALEQSDKFDKNDLKELICAIYLESVYCGIKLDEDELDYIYKITHLSELNTKSHAILTPLLMMIYEKGRR